MNITRNK